MTSSWSVREAIENQELPLCQLCRRQWQMWSCHNANFVITGITTGRQLLEPPVMTKLVLWQSYIMVTSGDNNVDKVGIISTLGFQWYDNRLPDSKVHGANMGPTWVLSAPGEPHVGPMNLAIRATTAHPPNMCRVLSWHALSWRWWNPSMDK